MCIRDRNNEALSDRLKELRDQLWDISKNYTKPVDVAEVRRQALNEALNEALNAVGRVKDNFMSDEYATSQPMGSLSERFACDAVSEAILALSDEPAQGGQSDLAWLNTKTNFEISHGWPEGGDESDDGVWRVHSVNGGRSDREWTLIAEDSDLSTALSKARKTLAAPTLKGQQHDN